MRCDVEMQVVTFRLTGIGRADYEAMCVYTWRDRVALTAPARPVAA